MKRTSVAGFILMLTGLVMMLVAQGQISEMVPTVKFGVFNITSTERVENGRRVLYLSIFKGSELQLTDSLVKDGSDCQGFAFPQSQPFKEYFIFSKHAKHAGLTYILGSEGVLKVIPGGAFWAAPKDRLLFVLAEKEYRNLLVFSLRKMETVFEKFSCDEFTNWYYSKGKYFGKVASECGDELKTEKEVSEWMHPVEIEQYDVRSNTLNEMHLTEEQVEHARVLVKYAGCR